MGDAMSVETWPRHCIESIRKATKNRSRFADQDDGLYLEWEWQFGVVYTKTTLRSAVCVDCGKKIPSNTPCLFALYTETVGGGWTPKKRFLHLSCPETQP